MALEVWQERNFLITSWNWWYRIYKNNNIVSVYATSESNKFTVVWEENWNTRITVIDSEWKTDSFPVSVSWDVTEEETNNNDSSDESHNNQIVNPDLREIFSELLISYDDTQASIASADWRVEINSLNIEDQVQGILGKYPKTTLKIVQQRINTLRNKYSNWSQKRDLLEMLNSVNNDLINWIRLAWYDFTKIIEDWQVWWVYFENYNSYNVREIWVKLGHLDKLNQSAFPEKISFEKSSDAIYAAIILPKKRYVQIQWYVIDNTWREIATYQGVIDRGMISLADRYPGILETESVDEDWVEINGLPLIYFGVIALVNAWLKVHDWYTTIRDCHTDWYLSINCAVNLWLSVIPVSWWKQAKNVLEFAGSSKKHGSSVKKYSELPSFSSLWIKWSTVPKPDLNKIQNDTLKNIVNQQYRSTSTIWNKSTADAIRYEKKTWILLSPSGHIWKWQKDSQWLRNLIENGQLSWGDKNIAWQILKDLTDALNGK